MKRSHRAHWRVVWAGSVLTSLASVSGAAVPSAVDERGPVGTDVGQVGCMDDTDYDSGYCWALLNRITDPNDCTFDAPSDEFVEGCLAYTGTEGLEAVEE